MNSAPSISSAPAKATVWNRNFICTITANFLFVMAHWSVNTLVATYATFLGAAPVIMGLLTGMFFVISFALRPVSGPMITKIDKRKLMIAAYVLGGVVNLGYALFHSIPFFVFFRFLNGVQYSFVGSLILTVAGDSLPKEKMASGMGIYGVGGAIGTALGPSVSIAILSFGTRLVSQDFGFTLVFLIGAVLQILCVVPSFLMHPDKKTKEDIASTGAWYKNIASVHAVPTTIIMFLIQAGYALYNTYVVNLANEQGIGNVGIFYTFLAIFLVVFRPLSGWLTDRFGTAKVVIPGLVIFAVSFYVVGSSKSIEMVLFGAVLAAIGIGSTQPAVQAMCIQSESALKRSVASNTLYIGMDLGMFAGPFLGSIIYKYSSYSVTFKTGVIPIVIALVCFVVFLPIYRRRRLELDQQEL